MVTARARFLGSGHYLPLTKGLADASLRHAPRQGLVLEVGAGTAYHLAHILESLPDRLGLAIDLSKDAARAAAKAHPRVGSVVADMWDRLPLADESAGLTLDVFAPRQPRELHRTLRRNGILIVATPEAHHLTELRQRLGLLSIDPEKEGRLSRTLEPYFQLIGTTSLEWAMDLSHDEVAALVAMGPSARHVEDTTLARQIADLEKPATVTAAVAIRAYRRK